MSRNKWVATEPQRVVEGPNFKRQANIKRRGTRENAAIDKALSEERKAWVLIPPANMTIIYQGLVLSVPQPIGALLLYRKLGLIVERDFAIDAVIEGSIEDAVEAFGL